MKKRLLALLVIGVMTLAVGCGSSDSSYEGASSSSFATEEFAADGWDSGTSDYKLAENATAEAPRAESEVGEASEAGYDLSRKIVYTSSIGIESKKFDEDVAAVKGLISSNGGYIESSSQYGSEEYSSRDARLTARIPAKKYDEFMNAVGSIGSMTSKYEDVDDITASYVDVQARLKSLNTKLERLQELEQKAETVEELLSIEDRINDVQYQIESYTAQKRVYDDQVDYSTVDITVTEVATFTEIKKDTAWNRFVEAFQGSCSGFIAFLQTLVIVIIYLLPYAILVGIVLFAVGKIRKKKGKGSLFKFKKKHKDTEVSNTEK